MALADTLETSFSADGFDLDALVTSLTGVLGELGIAARFEA